MADTDQHDISMDTNVDTFWEEASAWNKSDHMKMAVDLALTLDPALSHTNMRRMWAKHLWVNCILGIAIAAVVAFRRLEPADEQRQSPLW